MLINQSIDRVSDGEPRQTEPTKRALAPYFFWLGYIGLNAGLVISACDYRQQKRKHQAVMTLASNISIRNKVALTFALVLCATIGLGLFSLNRLSTVEALAAEVRNNSLPSTRYLGRIAQAAERLRLNQYIAVTTASAERRKMVSGLIGEQAKLVETELARYLPLVSGDEGALAAAISKEWTNYKAIIDQVNALLAKGDLAQDVAILDNSNPAMNNLRNALQADIAFNVKEGDELADRGTALARSARTGIIAVLGAMALLCALTGWSL
ncbi:MAG: MCP four helix bundle domain-containing protein, partial [Acetobacteraceae bacterium]|nr:MCP four helix bundle domain-containing protein [Acetobacteraceae bacterium]